MTDQELDEFIKKVNSVPDEYQLGSNPFWTLPEHTTHYSDGFIEYNDSGVGEDYVLAKIQKSGYPNAEIESVMGGCDSCGYGRSVTTLLGAKSND